MAVVERVSYHGYLEAVVYKGSGCNNSKKKMLKLVLLPERKVISGI